MIVDEILTDLLGSIPCDFANRIDEINRTSRFFRDQILIGLRKRLQIEIDEYGEVFAVREYLHEVAEGAVVVGSVVWREHMLAYNDAVADTALQGQKCRCLNQAIRRMEWQMAL